MNRGRPGTLPARKNLSRQIFATPLPKFGARAPLGLPPPTYRTIDHKQKCAASTQNRGTPPRSWTAVEMPAATVAAGWVTAVQEQPGVPLKIAGGLEKGRSLKAKTTYKFSLKSKRDFVFIRRIFRFSRSALRKKRVFLAANCARGAA